MFAVIAARAGLDVNMAKIRLAAESDMNFIPVPPSVHGYYKLFLASAQQFL
jgi:hypothetical protein